MVCLFLFFGEECLFKVLPQNTEQYTLHTVGEDLSFKTTEHQARNSRLGDNILDNLGIRNLLGVGLLVDLADSNRVGASVTDGR